MTVRHPGRAAWRLAALLLPLALLGSECQGPAGESTLWLVPPAPTIQVGDVLEVDVVVNLPGHALQAYELDVVADPPLLVPYEVLPHPDFDDDGELFRPPVLDVATGRVEGVVDLRHGPAAAGDLRLVSVKLYAVQAGSTTVTVDGLGLSDPTGVLVPAEPAGSVVTITAP